MSTLFDPCQAGVLTLRNRIAMAPMTRARNPDGVANELTALYYSQRASAGLIITEGTPISRSAEGFLAIPGIYTTPQINGWRKVTQAVHDAGGVIFTQLWHVGRVSHVSIQPDGIAPVSSTSRIARNSQAWGVTERGEPGPVDVSTPAPSAHTKSKRSFVTLPRQQPMRLMPASTALNCMERTAT